MIKEIKIYELFGRKNNLIKIKFNESLTILVGKNGCGKTTILNIINIILNGSFHRLKKYNFKKIIFKYDDANINIYKFGNDIVFFDANQLENYNVNDEKDYKDYKNFLIKFNESDIEKIKILNEEDDEELYDNNILKHHPKPLYFPTYRRTEIDFSEFLWQLQDVPRRRNTFINDRLINNLYLNYENFENVVVGITNDDIVKIIRNEWLNVSNLETQKLNSLITDFFLCFIGVNGNKNSYDVLRKTNIDDLNRNLKSIFENTGLAKKGRRDWKSRIDTYTDTVSKAQMINENHFSSIEPEKKTKEKFNNSLENSLENFLEDMNIINSITHSLDKITAIIELYKDACNSIEEIKAPFKELEKSLSDFMNPKIAKIQDGNLYFQIEKEHLLFEDLSAGEKQLVTLFVYTSLVARDGATIMIDEPELSLHVTWQRKIIKNLLNNKKNVQYIIATHSPFVISDYRESIKKVGEIDYEELIR